MGTLQQAIDETVRDRRRLAISFVNPNYVMRAHADADLRVRMNTFDIMLADGWGVVGGRLLGVSIPTRLANDDVGEDCSGSRQRTATAPSCSASPTVPPAADPPPHRNQARHGQLHLEHTFD
jgi:UDP-N-acetyl-D-mannosaminuronic acid transferase (WecB/TagA/CpsF family)